MFYEIIILSIALLVFIIIVYPTVWVFIASFKSNETLFSNEHSDYTLSNYIELLESGFGLYIINSFYICLVSVVITIFISVIAAYIFSRKKFKFKIFYFGSIMLGQTFPWIILVTPMFILFAKLGFLNNHISMIFCYVSVRYLPKFFQHNYRIVYSDIENVKSISNINHPPTKAALNYFKSDYTNILKFSENQIKEYTKLAKLKKLKWVKNI